MFQKFSFFTISSLFIIGFLSLSSSSCSKKTKYAKQGEKCGQVKCVKGLKCWRGVCEDVSGNNTDCKFLRSASKAIMNANPKELLKGLNYKYDANITADIPTSAASIYKAFASGLPQKECKRITNCELPKLGIGYAWFWTRAAYNSTKTIPTGAKKVSSGAVQIVSATTKQGAMGEDKNLFPEEKIRQMRLHRVGCKAEVKVRVREDYAGFVTFHFWRNTGCVFQEPEKGKKDSKAQFVCKGKEQLNKPDYTYTIYLYPFSSKELKSMSKKNKKGGTMLTGNPGTYTIDVWAHNPINEKLFGEHKQFEDESKIKNKYPELKFCPKYVENPFNDGCGCIGLAKNKITVTLDPDPFFLPYNEEKCNAPQKKK